MNTSLLMIIKWIIDKHGEGILNDPIQLKKIFPSYAQNEPKEERIAFGRCIEMGCYMDMKKARTEDERGKIKANLIVKLHHSTGLNMTHCIGALDLLDAVLFGNVVQTQLSLPKIQTASPQIPAQHTQQGVKSIILILKKITGNKKNVKLIGLFIALIVVLSLVFAVGTKITSKSFPSQDLTENSLDNRIDALKKITEYQEQIAFELEQIKKQIEEEERKQIEAGYITSSQKTEQERLIEKLNNELLLEILNEKRHGMKDITGRIKIVVLPVNYKGNRFKTDLDKLAIPVQEGISIILNQAKKYNQNITMDWSYSKDANGSYVSLGNSLEGLNLYPRYGHDPKYSFTVLVFAIDRMERSYCSRRSDGSHAIMWFKDRNGHSSGTLAHEIFHAFGAEDLYYEKGVVPQDVERNFKLLLGNSIMITSQGSSGLDPINSWLIGWNKKPEPWYAWFVDKRNASNLELYNR